MISNGKYNMFSMNVTCYFKIMLIDNILVRQSGLILKTKRFKDIQLSEYYLLTCHKFNGALMQSLATINQRTLH